MFCAEIFLRALDQARHCGTGKMRLANPGFAGSRPQPPVWAGNLEQSVSAYERSIHAFADFLARVEQQIRLITEQFITKKRERARQLQFERIPELISVGVELDLYWNANTTLAEIKAEYLPDYMPATA